MKCVALSVARRNAVNTINNATVSQKIEVIKLTDNRYVIDADVLYDADWTAWGGNVSLKSLTIFEATGSLLWENKILTLCARDGRSIATPELFEAAKAYYLGRGEI